MKMEMLIFVYVIFNSVFYVILLTGAGIFCGLSLADVPPTPLTPDYGRPDVSYADGILDTQFNRFICVREGK